MPAMNAQASFSTEFSSNLLASASANCCISAVEMLNSKRSPFSPSSVLLGFSTVSSIEGLSFSVTFPESNSSPRTSATTASSSMLVSSTTSSYTSSFTISAIKACDTIAPEMFSKAQPQS
ncbi:hypothetical protein HanRHA438_Chr09g0393631 [Helianthus annuus]|nr:hypothetical protein HanRHA438_Chr09g0393631 [Helianthus annuus]